MSTLYEIMVWGIYYFVEFVTNILVCVYVLQRLGVWKGISLQKDIPATSSSAVSEAGQLVGNMAQLAKGFKEAMSTDSAKSSPSTEKKLRPSYDNRKTTVSRK